MPADAGDRWTAVPADVAAALNALQRSGYGDSAMACIHRALLEAHIRHARTMVAIADAAGRKGLKITTPFADRRKRQERL